MWTALRVAALGAQAQQRTLDTAANNLANLQTAGFKRRRADLADRPPGPSDFAERREQVGQGADVSTVLTDLAAGPLIPTGRPLDVAIVGDGFFQVALPDGGTGVTRAGALGLDAEGRLTANGAPLSPPIVVPAGAGDVRVEADGRVVASVDGAPRELGRLTLARFRNPDGLAGTGQGLLTATAESGEPLVGAPGTNGLGRLEPSTLENSNVDVADEMVRVLRAQRAYQVNLRQLRSIDEMLQAAYGLRR